MQTGREKTKNKNGLLRRNRQIFILRYRKPFRAKKMERAMGIEPTTSAWKAGVLPLNYTRVLHDTLFSVVA